MSTKKPDILAVEPSGRDPAPVLRVLADPDRLDDAARVTLTCRGRHHVLGRLLKAGGQLVFTADQRFEEVGLDDAGRVEHVQCLWRQVDFVEESATNEWRVRCPCGPGAAIGRTWLLGQYRQSRGRHRRVAVTIVAGRTPVLQ